MSRRIKSAIAPIVVMLLAGGAAYAVHGSPRRTQPDPNTWIKQPSTWVPVYLEIEVRSPAGQVQLVRKHRAADGSLRVEHVGAPFGIEIDSVKAGMYFREQNGRWFAQPLRASGERKPKGMLRPARMKEVDRTDPRVAHLATTGRPLTFWEFPTGAIVSPELNMAVVYDELKNGSIHVVTKVDFTTPSAELFELPKNVVAEERSAPEGEGKITVLPSTRGHTRPRKQ